MDLVTYAVKQGARINRKRVFYEGSDDVRVGEPFCYAHDAGDVTDPDAERVMTVARPSDDNNLRFAGVALESKAGRDGGVYINIAEPGGPAMVWTNQNCTNQETVVTFEVGAGDAQKRFAEGGWKGRGSALCLQTVNRSSTAGLVMAWLMEGEESGGVEYITPPDNDAFTIMPGGTTFLEAATLGDGDATATLDDGLHLGMRKAIVSEEMTTNDVVLTVTNHEAAQPRTMDFTTDGDCAWMVWLGLWADILRTAPNST